MTSGKREAGDAQQAAFEAQAERIRQLNPAAAFEEAEDLADRLGELRGPAARLRAEQAQRVIDSGDSSVIELAQHMGVSRQRVYQLLKRARESRSD